MVEGSTPPEFANVSRTNPSQIGGSKRAAFWRITKSEKLEYTAKRFEGKGVKECALLITRDMHR